MHSFRDQMYVESLVPRGRVTQKYPIIFVHGQGQTGTVSFFGAKSSQSIPSWRGE